MPLLPDHFLDAVIAIGVGSASNRQWIGTGFFYGRPVDPSDQSDTRQYTIFLVTNRHVVQGIKKISIRLNSQADSTFKEYEVKLVATNGRAIWVGHPDPNVDIVAIWINGAFLQSDRRKFSFFEGDRNVISHAKLQQSTLSEGDQVFLLGYPMGLVGLHHHVICRLGAIARMRDVKHGDGKAILIDGLVFPGNSGGPVVTRPTIHSLTGISSYPSADLLGIVTSYVPYRDVAISEQTQKPRIIFEENSGLSVAHPAQLICETVDTAYARQQARIKHQARKVRPNTQA